MLTLGSIVAQLGGELQGDASLEVTRLAPLETAQPGELSFLSNAKYRQQLATSKAGCVIVAPAMRDEAAARGAVIVADDPYLYFARLTQLWKRSRARADESRVHASAVIDAAAVIDPTATIGALCVVERGVRIGAHT